MADDTETTEAAHGADAGAEHGADAGHGADHAAEAVGMPQLDFATFPHQIFWLVLALLAIYLILSRVALPRLGAVLAERHGTITNDLAAAEELKRQATEAEAAYDRALADARAQAQEIAAKTRADIQADLDAATERADAQIAEKAAESEARIAAIRDREIATVEEVARAAAAEIVGAFGGQANAAAVDQAVTTRMTRGTN